MKSNNTNNKQMNICIENYTNIQIFVTEWKSVILIRMNIQIYLYQERDTHDISPYICIKTINLKEGPNKYKVYSNISPFTLN